MLRSLCSNRLFSTKMITDGRTLNELLALQQRLNDEFAALKKERIGIERKIADIRKTGRKNAAELEDCEATLTQIKWLQRNQPSSNKTPSESKIAEYEEATSFITGTMTAASAFTSSNKTDAKSDSDACEQQDKHTTKPLP